MGKVKRNCDHCNNEYLADTRNLKRGWGLCCSKSCAAKKREMSKPGYDPERVKVNNAIRSGKLTAEIISKMTDRQKAGLNWRRFGKEAPMVAISSGVIQGITSEGYRIVDGVAYDEFDDPVYNVTGEDDPGDSMYYDSKDYR